MSGFDKIELRWKGQTYVVEPNRVLRLIARVEEVVTVDELVKYAQRQTAPMAKLSMAYGAALRYAGVVVTDEEIFESIFSGNNSAEVTQAVTGLLSMMIPKTLRVQDTAEVNAVGKSRGARQSHAASSKKRTKPSSASFVSSTPNSSGD